METPAVEPPEPIPVGDPSPGALDIPSLAEVMGRARRGTREERREYAQEVARQKQAVAAGLEPFDPLRVLASAMLHFNLVWGEYSEPTQEPQTTVEYLAAVLLEAPDHPEPGDVSDIGAFNEALWSARKRIRLIATLSTFTNWSLGQGDDPWEVLLGLLGSYRQSLRGPAYGEDETRLVRELFDPLAADVRRVAGMSIADGLDVFAGVADHLGDITEALVQRMHSRLADLKAAPLSALPPQMRRMSRKKRVRLVRDMAFAEMFLAPEITEHLMFSAADVHPEGLEQQAVETFLDLFVSPFDSQSDTHFLPYSPGTASAPFVKRSDRYLLTSPASWLHAFRPAVEKALAQDAAWPRYEAHRASVVERRATAAIAGALGSTSRSWMNLHYRIDAGDRYEVDGIVRCDDLLVVIEAKSGHLGFGDFRRAMRRLVGKSVEQSDRLANAIDSEQPIVFTDPVTGEIVNVDLLGVSRIESIAVTLDDLTVLNGQSKLLVATGLASTPKSVPWIVGLFDLEIISSMVEYPAQFSLYLRQRRPAAEKVVWLSDELDLWMCFLRWNLDLAPGKRFGLDPTFTADIDKHRMEGDPMPRQPLAPRSRVLVEAETRDGKAGFLLRSERIIREDSANRPPQPGKIDRAQAERVAMGLH